MSQIHNYSLKNSEIDSQTRKGIIHSNLKGKIYPTFTYRINSQLSPQKYIDFSIPQQKKQSLVNNLSHSINTRAYTIIEIDQPRKFNVYQSYINEIIQNRKSNRRKLSESLPKKVINSINQQEIEIRHLEIQKQCFLPKLTCLNNKEIRLKQKQQYQKQDINTEPTPIEEINDLLPWEASQKSFYS